MLTGLFAQLTYGAFYLTVYYNKVICSLLLITIGCDYFFVAVSFFTLFLIQTERCFGVFHPFRYEKLVADGKSVRKIILIIWIISGTMVLVSFFTPKLILLTIIAALLIPAVFIWSYYVQIKIVRQVHRVTKRMRKITPQTEVKTKDSKCYISRTNSRANRLAGLVLVAYIICYAPNVTINILRYFNNGSSILVVALVWTETLVFLNSIFNALLFCLQKKDVRCVILSSIYSFIHCSTTISEIQHMNSTCVQVYPLETLQRKASGATPTAC